MIKFEGIFNFLLLKKKKKKKVRFLFFFLLLLVFFIVKTIKRKGERGDLGDLACFNFFFFFLIDLTRSQNKNELITQPQIKQDYPLNLSILISGGKETN